MNTDWLVAGIVLVVILLVTRSSRRHAQRKARVRFIDEYRFPASIGAKIKDRYPHLMDSDLGQINLALRDYFQVCNLAGRRMVSMPSQVVDVAWHEFILFTRDYKSFCKTALGRFLHHTPAEAMRNPQQAQDGIKRAWRLACQRSGVDPKRPKQLPLLFAIDTDLNIPDGFYYVPDCTKPHSTGYCAGHIGCGGGCSGGCGGDSGSSCGGGCGGD